MTQRSNKVEIRVTDLEKQDWQEAAGGSRLVSDWLRRLANEACRLRREPALRTDESHVVPGAFATKDEIAALAAASVAGFPVRREYDPTLDNAKPKKQQVGSAPPECPRWMHHRSGTYCGSCKAVIK